MSLVQRLILGIALATSISANAFAFGQHTGSNVPVPTAETVTANLASTSGTFPANFVGVSEENDDFINGNTSGTSGASWSSLTSMFGTSGVLRIGGNTSDLTGGAPALTQTLANQIETNLTALGPGWSLIYGLNICINNTATAVTQAGYIINAVGINNVTFQFGNEPGKCTTIGTWQTRWNAYYNALVAAYPGVSVGGPDAVSPAVATMGAYIGSSASAPYELGSGSSTLSIVSFHWYTGINPSGQNAAQLLAATALSNLQAGGNGFQSSSSLAFPGIAGKLRVTETNTISGGGTRGISDRLVSAAFTINEAIELNALGINGYNVHFGCSTYPTTCQAQAIYPPYAMNADGNWAPRPIFYGMYLVSKLQGRPVAATSTSGGGNVNAISTVGTNGNANILVVNNDTANPVIVTPAQSSSWTTAKVLLLAPGSANNSCYDANPTLGGAAIGESGAWTGAPTTITNGQTVTLSPCAAALVQIQP